MEPEEKFLENSSIGTWYFELPKAKSSQLVSVREDL